MSSDPIWSDLRAGTIITVSEDLLDDVSYDPVGGDWWINVQAANGASGSYITASDFEVSNKDCQITIRDASAALVFGPAGEGTYSAGGVGSSDVFKLEEDPSPDITPFSSYNDGSLEHFRLAECLEWRRILAQDFSALRACSGDADCEDATVLQRTGELRRQPVRPDPAQLRRRGELHDRLLQRGDRRL